MIQEMRRKRQSLPMEEVETILRSGTSGVLALDGGGYPYAVPMSYVYDGGSIYFHCAKAGHKMDAVRRNAKASFCVIGQDQVVPEEYTTYFRSVIAFGQLRILENEEEKREAIEKLAVRYAPEDTQAGRQEIISREWAALCMLELKIDHMTGKEAVELVKQREQAD